MQIASEKIFIHENGELKLAYPVGAPIPDDVAAEHNIVDGRRRSDRTERTPEEKARQHVQNKARGSTHKEIVNG